MKHRFRSLLSTIVLSQGMFVAGVILQAPPAQAREVEPVTVQEAFDEALFKNTRGYYESQTTFRRIRELFGTGPRIFRRGNYPELNLERDARLTEELYKRILQAQMTSDPTLRVPDLPNPFNTSLLSAPAAQAGNRFVGGDLIFERLPLR